MDKIISYAIALGMAMHQKMNAPSSDLVSKTRAITYLKTLGYHHCNRMFDILCKSGKIHIYDNQCHDKAKKYFVSITELQTALLETEKEKLKLQ